MATLGGGGRGYPGAGVGGVGRPRRASGLPDHRSPVGLVSPHGDPALRWFVVEVYEENGTLVGAADEVSDTAPRLIPAQAPPRLNEKQKWVMARLAGEGKLTLQEVERECDISNRIAKRVLGEMSDAGLIAFDRTEHPGVYRLR